MCNTRKGDLTLSRRNPLPPTRVRKPCDPVGLVFKNTWGRTGKVVYQSMYREEYSLNIIYKIKCRQLSTFFCVYMLFIDY